MQNPRKAGAKQATKNDQSNIEYSPLNMSNTSFDLPYVLPRMRSSGSSFGSFPSFLEGASQSYNQVSNHQQYSTGAQQNFPLYQDPRLRRSNYTYGSEGYLKSEPLPGGSTPNSIKNENQDTSLFLERFPSLTMTPPNSFSINPSALQSQNFNQSTNDINISPNTNPELFPTDDIELDDDNETMSHAKRKHPGAYEKPYRRTKRPSITNSIAESTFSDDTNLTTSTDRLNSRQKWTKAEDERLRKAVKKSGGRNWKNISTEVGSGKTHIQCLQRWKQVLQPGLVKGAWARDEDERLMQLMKAFGGISRNNPNGRRSKFGQWKKIEQYMNGRTAKQCRERWLLNLDPTINKTDWQKPEDLKLIELQAKFGNSWSKIKDLLETNRTENAVKLRFNYLKKQKEKFGPENFWDHLDYKEGSSSNGNEHNENQQTLTKKVDESRSWSLEEDEMLILARKYYSMDYEEIKRPISRKSVEEIEKRWKYLCILDESLNERMPMNLRSQTDVNKAKLLASTEASRVLNLASRVTPSDLSTVGNSNGFSSSSRFLEEVTPYDNYDPERIFHKEQSFRENEFDEVLEMLAK